MQFGYESTIRSSPQLLATQFDGVICWCFLPVQGAGAIYCPASTAALCGATHFAECADWDHALCGAANGGLAGDRSVDGTASGLGIGAIAADRWLIDGVTVDRSLDWGWVNRLDGSADGLAESA